jgi:hypothetical protein
MYDVEEKSNRNAYRVTAVLVAASVIAVIGVVECTVDS